MIGGIARGGAAFLFLLAVAAAQSSSFTVSASYCTYLGGSNFDRTAGDQVTDAAGNLYLAGNTGSADFPVTAGAFDTSHNGGSDGFVMKLDPQGRIVWATYIGTPSRDELYGIKLDAQGNVVVAGTYYGPGAPTTSGALQTQFAGGPRDGFAAKFSPAGALVWATYIGTPGDDVVRGMVLDSSGNLLLATGGHVANPWPAAWTAGRFQSAPQGGMDSAVVKLRGDGAQVLWATYLGGSADEANHSNVAVDGSDRVYVLTITQSSDMPTNSGAFDRSHNGAEDAFVAALAADGRSMIFGTYLGTPQGDGAGGKRGIAVDRNGDVVVGVWTQSSAFPTTPGAWRSQPIEFTPWGSTGATVRLSPTGALVASTYFGNSEGVSLDSSGNVYVAGTTALSNFPVTADAYQSTHRGGEDGVICKLSSDLTTQLYGTYLGGSAADTARMTWLHSDGSFYAFGTTDSSNFPVLNASQPGYGGGSDIFIVKLAPSTSSPGTLQFSAASFTVNEGAGTATITVTRTGGSAGAVSVQYSTSNGSAQAGSDYLAASGTLAWADGDAAPKTFPVAVVDDAAVEPGETVNLALSAPGGGAALGAPSAAVLTIADNDSASTDADGDGMADAWEVANLGGTAALPGDDPDGDGATNLAEYLAQTDPNNPDTDGDGYTDGQELNAGSNPLDPSSVPGGGTGGGGSGGSCGALGPEGIALVWLSAFVPRLRRRLARRSSPAVPPARLLGAGASEGASAQAIASLRRAKAGCGATGGEALALMFLAWLRRRP